MLIGFMVVGHDKRRDMKLEDWMSPRPNISAYRVLTTLVLVLDGHCFGYRPFPGRNHSHVANVANG